MKAFIAVIILLFSVSSYSILEVEELKTLAEEDQKSLIEAVALIKGNLSDLTSRTQFEEYFELLPYLDDKANEYSLTSI